MRNAFVAVVIVAVVSAGLYTWTTRHPAFDPIDRPAALSFGTALLNKGEALVAIGDCEVCHTRPGGSAFAGGLRLPTPFGAIHSTNITPDPKTGIGRWSEAAFTRAMREGLDRNGNHLYPAFPYDHFTKITDDDIKAIYAYLMTLTPVAAVIPENELIFPLNYRFVMAAWNLLFLTPGSFIPNPSKNSKWNRGAYLVEGLAHCGACHTPRNLAGAEKRNQPYAGGEVDEWYAPALNLASPAPIPWSEEALVNYFLDGRDKHHGIAAGPMTAVANNLATLSEYDASAIAAYILSFQDHSNVKERAESALIFAAEREFGGASTPTGGQLSAGSDTALERGYKRFTAVCANCHRAGSQTTALALTSSVNALSPHNLIQVIDKGLKPPNGAADHSMPAFGGALSDADLADLVTFMRGHFSKRPAWIDVPATIATIRAVKE